MPAAGERVYANVRELDYSSVHAFFQGRASRHAGALAATMYQDEELAARRDAAEKATVLPLLAAGADDVVLDVGCGNGRWAAALAPHVARYLGIDFSDGLIAAARARVPGAEFHTITAQQFAAAGLPGNPRFSMAILSGIFAYLNDADAEALLARLSPAACVYVREPVARDVRLTLDRFWSDELAAPYSAVYRTADEYRRLFDRALAPAGFTIRHEGSPIGAALENRRETLQHFFILRRQERQRS